MEILLPPQLAKRLRRELRRAGAREIGGVLMAEHLEQERFRIVDITVQQARGTEVCFIRDLDEHQAQLREFFERTGRDYTRFNYLGEWHSHPSFTPSPSDTDIRTMQSIVEDGRVGVLFAALVIARLNVSGVIEATATAFRSRTDPLRIPLHTEMAEPVGGMEVARRWVRRLFRG